MWLLISIVGWVLGIALVFISAIHDDIVLLQEFSYFFLCFWGFYWVGNTAADTDRRTEITDATLPLWKRRILFLGQSNPFRRKTILFQTALVIGTPVVIVMWLIAPFTTMSVGVAGAWIIGILILAVICDIRIRRKYKDTVGVIDELRSLWSRRK